LARAKISAGPSWARVNLLEKQLDLEAAKLEEGEPFKDYVLGRFKLTDKKLKKRDARRRREDFWDSVTPEARASMSPGLEARLTDLAEVGALSDESIEYINDGQLGVLPATLKEEVLTPEAQDVIGQYFSKLELPKATTASTAGQKYEYLNPKARKASDLITKGLEEIRDLGDPKPWFSQAEIRLKRLPEGSPDRQALAKELEAARYYSRSIGGAGSDSTTVLEFNPRTMDFSQETTPLPLDNTWETD
jgi:hypothetical protein